MKPAGGARRGLTALAVAAAGLLASGRPAVHGLTFPGPLLPGLGEAIRVEQNSPWLLGSIPICPKGAAPVVVTAVKAEGDLRVSGFTVRKNPYLSGQTMLADARGNLEANGLTPTPDARLNVPCDGPKGKFYELVLELTSSDTETSATGYRIEYTSDGASGVLEVPYETHSCSSFTSKVCSDLKPSP